MPKPDGCTGIQWAAKPFYKGSFPWQRCCEEHDWAYIERSISRLEADKHFRQCVIDSGHPIKAEIMYRVIRALGWILWYT